MEGLLSKEIKESLENIVSHCFYCNRMLDRICSLLTVTFVMSNTESILHSELAHIYPLLADDITNYMADRDCTAIYGATPAGDQNYESPLEMFNKILEIQTELEILTKKSIALSEAQLDITTKVFLEEFLRTLIPITKDILTIVDKMEMYGESKSDWMKFDHDIEDFGVFGV